MMSCIFRSCVIVLLIFTLNNFLFGQAAPGTAVAHMSELDAREQVLSQNYMSYMSEVAHGGRARKMEKRRSELIASLRTTIRETNSIKPYKGDASLRDAYKEYWSVLLSVFTEDYEKIVDMEEVSEQSYDAMEAYLLIQEKAGQTLERAYKKVAENYKAFAEKHGVALVEGEKSKLTGKLEKSGRVNGYLNRVYLIFFKSYVQEGSMIKAAGSMDINAVEQSKSSLRRYAAEGVVVLDTMRAFEGDASLVNACKKVMEFHQAEADKAEAFSDFLLKHERVEKIKKTLEAKPASQRTQQDLDTYNTAVKEFNNAVAINNKLNKELNDSRSKILNNWEGARRKFLDVHIPHK